MKEKPGLRRGIEVPVSIDSLLDDEEAQEEIQMELDQMNYLVSFPNTYVYKGIEIPVTDVFFSCPVASFENLTIEQEEVASLHVCRLTTNDLEQMAFPSNRQALQVFLRAQ